MWALGVELVRLLASILTCRAVSLLPSFDYVHMTPWKVLRVEVCVQPLYCVVSWGGIQFRGYQTEHVLSCGCCSDK